MDLAYFLGGVLIASGVIAVVLSITRYLERSRRGADVSKKPKLETLKTPAAGHDVWVGVQVVAVMRRPDGSHYSTGLVAHEGNADYNLQLADNGDDRRRLSIDIHVRK
jgi:hypothetical protein